VVDRAGELRPVAELLEMPPWLDSPYATAIRGLLRLGPQAWSAVEGGEVSPYGAATIGNGVDDEAGAAARADREMMMIADLARQELLCPRAFMESGDLAGSCGAVLDRISGQDAALHDQRRST
jgi:hypothetical protein